MQCTFKYLNKSLSWTTFGRLVRPVNFGDTIKNEASSAYPIRLYFNGSAEIEKEALTPGTICKLDFGTKEYQYVIVDGGKINNKSGIDYCYHSYTIQELLSYTREIFVQSAYFSYGQYTSEEFFERLFALSDSDIELVIDKSGDYSVLSSNWKKPEYQISSNALLDNLIKIGQSNAVRVKVRLNSENHLELYFKSLKGTEEITAINGTKVNEDSQYLGANYSSRVNALASNLTNSEFAWYPNPSPSRGLRAEPESDTLTIEPNTAVVKIPYKIKNANKLRFNGLGKIITNSDQEWNKYLGQDYRVFDMDGNRINAQSGKYVSVDYDSLSNVNTYGEMGIVSYEKYKTLDPDDSQGNNVNQENTIYFKKEDNKIFNIKAANGGGLEVRKFNSSPICYVEVYDSGGSYLYTDYIYPEFNWYKNLYIINASYYANALVSIENGLPSKRTTIYSQDGNIVPADPLVNNLNTYIKSMKNVENALVYQFDSIDDLPVVGQIYQGKVISNITCNAYFDKIEATIQLSDELVKKSEYLSADDGIDFLEVDINKAFDRYTNYKTKLWFCKDMESVNNVLSKFEQDIIFNKEDYSTYILDAIKNDRNLAAIGFAVSELKIGDLYTAANPNVISADNSLFVIFKTLNNVTIGYMRDKSLGENYDKFRYYPIGFSEGEKEKKLQLKFKTGIANLDDFPRYPAIDKDEFDNDSGLIANVFDDKYHRDPAETININYQIEAVTDFKDGYVKKEYWDESTLLNDLFFNEDAYTRYYIFYSVDSEGNKTYPFGFQNEINNVNINYQGDSIAQVDIELPSGVTIPTNLEGYLRIKRRLNEASLLTEDDLLFTQCKITGSDPYYLTYYAVFANTNRKNIGPYSYELEKLIGLSLNNLTFDLITTHIFDLEKSINISLTDLTIENISPIFIDINKNISVSLIDLSYELIEPILFNVNGSIKLSLDNLSYDTIKPILYNLNKNINVKLNDFAYEIMQPILYNINSNINVSLNGLQFVSGTPYTVTYNLDGGTNDQRNPDVFVADDLNITLYNPIKSNYTFEGWYDNASFTGSPITQITTTGNKTYYAKWSTVDLKWALLGSGTNGNEYSYNEALGTVASPETSPGVDANNYILGWKVRVNDGGFPTTTYYYYVVEYDL